jgi:hypothetical protein
MDRPRKRRAAQRNREEQQTFRCIGGLNWMFGTRTILYPSVWASNVPLYYVKV